MRHPGCRTRALAEGNGIRRHMQQRRAGGVVVPSPRDVRKRSWLMFSPDRRPRTDASPPRTQNPPTTRSVPKGAGPDAGLHPPTGTSAQHESQPAHPDGRPLKMATGIRHTHAAPFMCTWWVCPFFMQTTNCQNLGSKRMQRSPRRAPGLTLTDRGGPPRASLRAPPLYERACKPARGKARHLRVGGSAEERIGIQRCRRSSFSRRQRQAPANVQERHAGGGVVVPSPRSHAQATKHETCFHRTNVHAPTRLLREHKSRPPPFKCQRAPVPLPGCTLLPGPLPGR